MKNEDKSRFLKYKYNKILDTAMKQEKWILKNSKHEKIDSYINKFEETLQGLDEIRNIIEEISKKISTEKQILEGYRVELSAKDLKTFEEAGLEIERLEEEEEKSKIDNKKYREVSEVRESNRQRNLTLFKKT